MINIIRELTTTPYIVIYKDPVDSDEFPEPLRFIRNYMLYCTHCGKVWNGPIYNGMTRSRICSHCETELFKRSISKKRQHYHKTMDIVNHKKKIHSEIIDIGMNPSRIYQTLLMDTLHLFKTPE